MQLTSSRNALSKQLAKRERKIHLYLFAFCFFAGSLLGASYGNHSSQLIFIADGYLLDNSDEYNLVLSVLWCLRFQLLAFTLGTSFLGVLLIPVLFSFRAFLYSYASSIIISLYPQNALLMTLIIVGLPALISIPCLMLISSEALSSSVALIRFIKGGYSRSRVSRCRYLLICLPIMAICVIIEIKLVPYLAALIAN